MNLQPDICQRLSQVTSDLKAIEGDLLTLEPDAEALSDFLQAANHMRRTAWTAQLWVERSARRERPFDLMLLLVAERVRVATGLCHELTDNIDNKQLTVNASAHQALARDLKKLDQMLTLMI